MKGLRGQAMVAMGLYLVAANPATAQKVGQPAPKFLLTTFQGQKLGSDDLRGSVVILNYWATWCAPCRLEMAALDKYVRAHGAEGLKVIAITTEDSVPDYKLKPLAAALSFPLAYNPRSWHYGTINGSVPSSYVIDKSGVVRYAKAGAFNETSLDEVVGPLLKAEAAASPTN